MSPRRPELPLIDDWTAEQALAIYDFCARISDLLWASHADVLLEQMIERPEHGGFSARPSDWVSPREAVNLELAFGDEEPF